MIIWSEILYVIIITDAVIIASLFRLHFWCHRLWRCLWLMLLSGFYHYLYWWSCVFSYLFIFSLFRYRFVLFACLIVFVFLIGDFVIVFGWCLVYCRWILNGGRSSRTRLCDALLYFVFLFVCYIVIGLMAYFLLFRQSGSIYWRSCCTRAGMLMGVLIVLILQWQRAESMLVIVINWIYVSHLFYSDLFSCLMVGDAGNCLNRVCFYSFFGFIFYLVLCCRFVLLTFFVFCFVCLFGKIT